MTIPPAERDKMLRVALCGPRPPMVAEDPEASTARWLPYIQDEDLDEATRRAQELGATVVQPRTAGPAGFFTTISDPTGAQVALWQGPSEDTMAVE